MKQKGIRVLALIVSVTGLFSVHPALANYKMVNGPKDFYFGHISYVEIKNDGKDPVVYREGQARPESALLNLPLGPPEGARSSLITAPSSGWISPPS
jgi:hypothetical protein